MRMASHLALEIIVDKVNWVRHATVLGLRYVVVIDLFRRSIDRDVLKHSTRFNCIVNVRFIFDRQVNSFGIASTFEIENSIIIPSMLIISDQESVRISRECGLAYDLVKR